MNNNDLKKYLKRRLSCVQGRFNYVKDYNPDKHTFHGGWEQAYTQGQLSILEDIIDLIEEEEYTYEMFTEDCDKLNELGEFLSTGVIRCFDTPPLEPKKVDWLDINSKTFGIGDNSFNVVDG